MAQRTPRRIVTRVPAHLRMCSLISATQTTCSAWRCSVVTRMCPRWAPLCCIARRIDGGMRRAGQTRRQQHQHTSYADALRSHGSIHECSVQPTPSRWLPKLSCFSLAVTQNLLSAARISWRQLAAPQPHSPAPLRQGQGALRVQAFRAALSDMLCLKLVLARSCRVVSFE